MKQHENESQHVKQARLETAYFPELAVKVEEEKPAEKSDAEAQRIEVRDFAFNASFFSSLPASCLLLAASPSVMILYNLVQGSGRLAMCCL